MDEADPRAVMQEIIRTLADLSELVVKHHAAIEAVARILIDKLKLCTQEEFDAILTQAENDAIQKALQETAESNLARVIGGVERWEM